MGKFNQASLVTINSAVEGFVPQAVWLQGRRAEVVWRSRLGGVQIVSAKQVAPNLITILLNDGQVFKCKSETFGGSFPPAFVDAIRSAFMNSTTVELCVAVSSGGRAAEGFFCGLREASSTTSGLVIGQCDL